MPLFTTLAALSTTPAGNAPDGAVDAPSTIDDNMRLLASFVAQLRDGARAGQCRLVKTGANLVLLPYNGNSLVVNGVPCSIPSAGVSLAATALTPGTTYFIYAVATSGVITSLEASTTAHVTDTATGVEIKTGDATRSLVGMARPITGPAWQDVTNQRFVLSWFNRRPLAISAVLGTNTANVGTTYSLLGAALNLEYLLWGGDTPVTHFQGALSNNVGNAVSFTSIFVDGVGNESYTATGAYISAAVQPISCSVIPTVVAEGYHIHQIYAKQNVVSTATYNGGGVPGDRCVHSGLIQG